MSWPIIVVTGANSGVGFGICQRLLCQLSEKTPSDTLMEPLGLPPRKPDNERTADQFILPCEGITLIMACRSVQRAEVARQKMLLILDKHIEKLRNRSHYDGHAESFRRNVKVVIHSVDLASLDTIPKFVQQLQSNYPYISHLICNAGIAPFTGINWLACFRQICLHPLAAFTTPNFYTQSWGELSQDGYGFTWQCNVFGHYTLYRELYPLLSSSKYVYDSRVIWTSSVQSTKTYADHDWQLKETQDPYGASKYQTDLISMELDRRALDTPDASKVVRHLIAHPGVTHTNIDIALIHPLLHYLKHFVFHLARWLGSPNHPITLDKGAVSVVWLSIISLSILSGFSSSSSAPKFGSQTNWIGDPRVGVTEIEQKKEEGKVLVDNCESLYLENHAARI